MTTATSWLGVLPNAPLRMSASAGVASAPIAIEVIVTPIWTAEMYSLMRSSWLQGERGAARAFLAHQFQARSPGAHERVLGGDEERVDRDQDDREYELQPVHAGSAPVRADLLRGGFSSSFIGGRRAQP